jgi:hypothetical protein
MPRWFSPLSSLLILTSCLGHSTTDAGQPPQTGPYATVSTELKDASSAPAASVLTVRAHVTHDGTAIAGAPVKFTVAAGHGRLSVDSTATDTLGVAVVLWTLGDTASEVNSLAIVSGDGVDTLHVAAVAGSPSYLVPVSTTTDVAVGAALAIQVRATDRPGNPVAGATVFWVATGGTLSSASSVTDANGIARVTFMSTQSGSFTLSAVLPETATRDFHITVH